MQIIKVVKTVISFFLFCSIRVVVEDKESSGGAFSMKVSPTATIERLQQEVTCREIPVPSQWIFLTLSCNINSSSYFSSNKYTPRYGSIHHAEFNNLNTCSLLRVLYKLVKIWDTNVPVFRQKCLEASVFPVMIGKCKSRIPMQLRKFAYTW